MMSSSKATAQIQNENSDKNDDVFLNMEFNEDEMKFPIKSEEQVCKERNLDVNGMFYYEKRKCERGLISVFLSHRFRPAGLLIKAAKVRRVLESKDSLRPNCRASSVSNRLSR